MAGAIQYLVDGYNDVMDNRSDQRVNDWFLMGGPLPTIAASALYALFVTKIGPKLMENRKPFELKSVLIVYNAFQVVFSTWLFYEACASGWATTYSFRCQPVDFSNDPMALRMARGCWWYYISKFTEFLDTIFFVLRKKNDHISTLHVIHHGIMPVSVWWGVKFFPGGQSTFFGLLNTFVHIIMYSYYMLAAMGPRIQKYLWWKKHLTLLQMVQFVMVVLHSAQVFFIECDYPKSFQWFIMVHAIMFYFLFSNFYKQTYKPKDKTHAVPVNESSKGSTGVCFTKQTELYQAKDSKQIQNGYTTSDQLRNRVFIDKKQSNRL